MTDARFPERWLNDRRVIRLSDAGFRLFVTALAYSVANRTDGQFDKDDLECLRGTDAHHIDELVDAGLMAPTSAASWASTVYAGSQSSKSQLDGYDWKREQERRRQANKRARDRGEPEPFPKVSRDIERDSTVTASEAADEAIRPHVADQALSLTSRDSTRDVTPDVDRDTKARPGQARQGASKQGPDTRSTSPPCPHGTVNGDQPDPWLKGRMACPECAAQSQPESEAS